MNAPEVTVVIPTYNRTTELERAIRSALLQNGVSVQVVVVDDGSPASPEAVIQSVDDSRVKFVRLEANHGGGFARNLGVQNADAEYVAFLDSDDWWHEDKLKAQFDVLRRRGELDHEWIIYNTIIRLLKDGTEKKPDRPLRNDEPLDDFLITEKNYIQTSGLFATKALFSKYRFDETLPRHQDIDLALQLREGGVEFICCDTEFVFYDQSSGGSGVGWIRNKPHASMPFLEKYWSRLGRKARSHLVGSDLFLPLLMVDPAAAIRLLLRCGVTDPRVFIYVAQRALVWSAGQVRRRWRAWRL